MKPYIIRFEVAEVNIQFENGKISTYSNKLYDNWCLCSNTFDYEYYYQKHIIVAENELKEAEKNIGAKYNEKLREVVCKNIDKYNKSNKFSRFLSLGTTQKIIDWSWKIKGTSVSLEDSTFDYLSKHFSMPDLLRFKETILEEIKK